jgi:uncharacterized protein YcbK (DUF882 family)
MSKKLGTKIAISVLIAGGVYAVFRMIINKINLNTEIMEGDKEITTGGTNVNVTPPVSREPKGKYFNLSEFHSNDGAKVPKEYYGNLQQLINNLDVLREYLGSALFINSGYRSPSHNRKIGGAKNSQHLFAKAADLRSVTKSPKEIKQAIETLIAQGKMSKGGVGIYNSFVHYDVRGTNVRWTG